MASLFPNYLASNGHFFKVRLSKSLTCLKLSWVSTSYQIISVWKSFDIAFVSPKFPFGVILTFSCQLMQSFHILEKRH